MSIFKGTVDQIENNTLKVDEINDTNPEGAYPSTKVFKDFIVAQGTKRHEDDILWTYQLWNSGKAECWGTITRNIGGTNHPWQAWGENTGLYCSDAAEAYYPTDITVGDETLTNLFASPPICEISFASSKGNDFILTPHYESANTYEFYTPFPRVIYYSNEVAYTLSMNFYAIGKWK